MMKITSILKNKPHISSSSSESSRLSAQEQRSSSAPTNPNVSFSSSIPQSGHLRGFISTLLTSSVPPKGHIWNDENEYSDRDTYDFTKQRLSGFTVCVAICNILLVILLRITQPDDIDLNMSTYDNADTAKSLSVILCTDLIDYVTIITTLVILSWKIYSHPFISVQMKRFRLRIPRSWRFFWLRHSDAAIQVQKGNKFDKVNRNRNKEISIKGNHAHKLRFLILILSLINLCIWYFLYGDVGSLGEHFEQLNSFLSFSKKSDQLTIVIVRKRISLRSASETKSYERESEENLSQLLASLAIQNTDFSFDLVIVDCSHSKKENSTKTQQQNLLSFYLKIDEHDAYIRNGMKDLQSNKRLNTTSIKWLSLQSCPESDQSNRFGPLGRISYMKKMGIEHANSLSKYILFLDDDLTLSKPHFIQSMVDLYKLHSNEWTTNAEGTSYKHHYYPSAGAVGCKIVMAPLRNHTKSRNSFIDSDGGHNTVLDGGSILWADGSYHVYGYGRQPYRIRHQYNPNIDYDEVGGDETAIADDLQYARPVDFVSGSCLLFSRRHYDYVGGFGSSDSYKIKNDARAERMPSVNDDIEFQMTIQYNLNKFIWFQPVAVAQQRAERLKDPLSTRWEDMQHALNSRWSQELQRYHVASPNYAAVDEVMSTSINNFPKSLKHWKAMDIRSHRDILSKGKNDGRPTALSKVDKRMLSSPPCTVLYVVPYEAEEDPATISASPQVNPYKRHLLKLAKLGHRVSAILILPFWTKLDDDDFAAGCSLSQLFHPSPSDAPSLYSCGAVQRLRQHGIEVITARTGPTIPYALLRLLLSRPCLYDTIIVPKEWANGKAMFDDSILSESVTHYLLHQANYPIITVSIEQFSKTFASLTKSNMTMVKTVLDVYSNLSHVFSRKTIIPTLRYNDYKTEITYRNKKHTPKHKDQSHEVWGSVLRAAVGSSLLTSSSPASVRPRGLDLLLEEKAMLCDKTNLYDLIYHKLLLNRCQDLEKSYLQRYMKTDDELKKMINVSIVIEGKNEAIGLAHFYKFGYKKGYVYDEEQERLYLISYPHVKKRLMTRNETGFQTYKTGFEHFQQHCCNEDFLTNPNEIGKYIYSVYDEIVYRYMNRDVSSAVVGTLEEVGPSPFFSGWHHYMQFGLNSDHRKYGCW